MTVSRSIHVAANGIISFHLMTNIPLYVCTMSSFSIPLLMGKYIIFKVPLLSSLQIFLYHIFYPYMLTKLMTIFYFNGDPCRLFHFLIYVSDQYRLLGFSTVKLCYSPLTIFYSFEGAF